MISQIDRFTSDPVTTFCSKMLRDVMCPGCLLTHMFFRHCFNQLYGICRASDKENKKIKIIKDFDSFDSLINWDGRHTYYINEGQCSTDNFLINQKIQKKSKKSKSLKSKIHEEMTKIYFVCDLWINFCVTKIYVTTVRQYFSRIVCFGVRNKNVFISRTIRATIKFTPIWKAELLLDKMNYWNRKSMKN